MGKTKNRVGETNTANCGMKMTIIRYGSYNDIDVKFEDGTIVKNRTYRCFKRGMISHPNYYLANRLGETKIASCGMKMTIIRYNTATDIDVQFGDGTIVTHKEYASFKKGEIKNPNYDPYASKVGEETMSSCGMIMEIIRYNNSNDIDVKFEDGTIVKNKSYNKFIHGTIQNPNNNSHTNRLGKVTMSSCGLKMKIIEYKNYNDIDIRFEDGSIVSHKGYGVFSKGSIAHPILSAKQQCIFKNIIARYSWSENGKVYYLCRCRKCGEEAIWTPQQMIEHAKKCSNNNM